MKNASLESENKRPESKFTGTENPRDLRAITALMTRPQRREHLDKAIGCSNAPDVILRLRRYGLDIPCDRIDAIDRDGKPVRPGVYHFNSADRRKVIRWINSRGAKNGR
jgi:hypothetical protein